MTKGNKRLVELCPYLLVFISLKFKAFHVTQNETPKMAKMSVSTTKLSHFPAEHAIYSDRAGEFELVILINDKAAMSVGNWVVNSESSFIIVICLSTILYIFYSNFTFKSINLCRCWAE